MAQPAGFLKCVGAVLHAGVCATEREHSCVRSRARRVCCVFVVVSLFVVLCERYSGRVIHGPDGRASYSTV